MNREAVDYSVPLFEEIELLIRGQPVIAMTALIEASPLAIVATGASGKILLWSGEAARIFEVRAADAVGHEYLSLKILRCDQRVRRPA